MNQKRSRRFIIVLPNNPIRPAVVYLARKHDGVNAFQRFVNSYQQFPAGLDHDLIIIFKGFTSPFERGEATKVFENLEYTPIDLPDEGYDIGVYLKTVAAMPHHYFCFFNTHTKIVADNWLRLLHFHVIQEGVGMVGAMGSYESLQSSTGLINSILKNCKNYLIPYDKLIDSYYGFITNTRCKQWQKGSPTLVKRGLRRVQLAGKFLLKCLKNKRDLKDVVNAFPSFPNPHIRSNGFMVHRTWMDLKSWHPIVTKQDACLFESGPDSLTTRIQNEGLRCLVVDRHGESFDLPVWWKSKTFRIANQEDALFSDNQSRAFDLLDSMSKYTYSRMTWGDYLGTPPEEFPDFDFHFPVDSQRVK